MNSIQIIMQLQNENDCVCTVSYSTNESLVGRTGRVIDETLYLFVSEEEITQ